MEIELTGLGSGFFLLAVGLAFMGYFIGKGLQNMGHPEKGNYYYHFVKEDDLVYYLNLEKKEIQTLLERYPDAPKVELEGTIYYPYRQFMEWLSLKEDFNKRG